MSSTVNNIKPLDNLLLSQVREHAVYLCRSIQLPTTFLNHSQSVECFDPERKEEMAIEVAGNQREVPV